MADPVHEFFEGLAASPRRVPGNLSGTLRFDLDDGPRTRHWIVTIAKGLASAAPGTGAADSVFHTDMATFEAIVEGHMNVMAALLRGLVDVQGRALLVLVVRRLLTGTTPPHAAADTAGYARRSS